VTTHPDGGTPANVHAVLILAIIVLGMGLGAVAQWIVGRDGGSTDWAMALIAGIAGSFVGGLLFSLLAGDGLAFKPSGVIGSLVGAIVITFVWQQVRRRRAPEQPPQKATAKRR
jgi:uncharacterized membrane protein YeaQ/YmgE (transglycosylase-associated protein family)